MFHIYRIEIVNAYGNPHSICVKSFAMAKRLFDSVCGSCTSAQGIMLFRDSVLVQEV